MKQKRYKNIFVAILTVIICIVIEVFIFNGWYFKLNGENRGHQYINSETVQGDSLFFSNGMFFVEANASFSINSSTYIARLIITVTEESPFFDIPAIIANNQVKRSTRENIVHNLHFESNNMAAIALYGVANEFIINMRNNGQIAFTLTVDNSLQFNVLRFIFMFLVAFFIYFFVFYSHIIKENAALTFVIIALGTGLLLSFLINPYFIFDERQHFVMAYRASVLDFSYGSHPNISWPEDAVKFLYQPPRHYSYSEKIDMFNKFSTGTEMHEIYIHSTASLYGYLPYIAPALGIAIGRLFGLPFIWLFYIGRIFSFAVYVLIGYYAIKYTRIAQRLMVFILLFPAVIYGASGYTADTMALVSSMALISVFSNMFFAKNQSINYKLPLIFTLSAIGIIFSKSPYVPLILLITTVPSVKFKNFMQSRLYKSGIIALCIVATICMIRLGFSIGVNQWGIYGVNGREQISFVFSNMSLYINIIINHFMDSPYDMLNGSTSFFAYSGNLRIIWLASIIISLFILAVFDHKENDIKLGIKDKCVIALSVALSWGMVVTALYVSFTPVSHLSINGVQGRYVTPLILPALLLLKNRIFVYKGNEARMQYVLMGFITFLLLITNYHMLYNFNY
jgi:uncharacterized membrane protein